MKSVLDNDYVNIPVPENARKGYLGISFVWIGFIIVVGIMAVGGSLVKEATWEQVLTAVILGNIILGAFAAIFGYIGSTTGKTFSQLASDSFPGKSWYAVSMYPAIALMGWYAIECAIFGNFLAQVFEIDDFGKRLLMSVSAILFAITPYIGWKGIKWISVVFVPIIILIGVYVVIKLLNDPPDVSFVTDPVSGSFTNILALVIGSWILGVIACYPDLARFARNPIKAALIGFFGILIFNSLTLLLGVAGAYYSNQFDPSLILFGLGSIPLAVLLGITNLWTTNDNNLYSASLNVSRIFNLDRKKTVLICAGVSFIIAYFNPSDLSFFWTFLRILGVLSPALGGVIFATFVLRNSISGMTSKHMATINWFAWLCGVVLTFLLNNFLAIPLGFLLAFIISFFLTKRYSGVLNKT